MTKYLGNDKYLKRLHGLIVRYGEDATVMSVTPLEGDAIMRDRGVPDRLLADVRRFLGYTVRRNNGNHTTGLATGLVLPIGRDSRNSRQGDKEAE